MIFDIHSHILPNVDDGSTGMEESISMLREMKRQGVEKALATPHFYAKRRSIDEYVSQISESFTRLVETTRDMDVPELFCGSEVSYFKGMSHNDDLEKLCIHSTRYIMIELPYEELSERVEDEINDLVLNRGLTPIIAHLDRSLKFNSYERLLRLFRYGDIKGQVNASALCSGLLTRKKAIQFFRDGCCAFLGSDAHNMTTRPVHIREAWEYIGKKLGEAGQARISDAAQQFYQDLVSAEPEVKYL